MTRLPSRSAITLALTVQNLRISKARGAEDEINTLQALAQMIAASLDEKTCDRIAERLIDPFPWMALLPTAQQREFVGEFLRLGRVRP